MRKFFYVLTSIVLVALATVALCACSSFGGIKSAYEKENYKEVEISDEMKKKFENNEDYKKIQEVVTFHAFQKQSDENDSLLGGVFDALNFVIIAEFKSNEEMTEYLKDHVTDKEAKDIYEELQKLDNVSGNCFLVFSTSPEGYNIFKSTK